MDRVWIVPPSKRRPLAFAVFLAVAQFLAGVFFTALAIALKDQAAAALAILGFVGSIWHTRKAFLIRSAQRRGAVALPFAAAPSSPGAAAPEAYEASLHRGPHAQDGMLVIVQGVSAFVPTGPWRTSGVHAAHALAGIAARRVVMAHVPPTAEALFHEVAARGGVYVSTWAWGPGRTLLKNPAGGELLSALMPGHAKARWPLAAWTGTERSAARRIVAVVGGLGGLCVAAGGIASAVFRQSDYLVAGVGYGAIFAIAAAVTHLRASGRT